MTTGFLGAVASDGGVRFTLYSAHAERVLLCLFDRPEDSTPARRVELRRTAGAIWQTVEDVPIGQLYGYQVFGPHQPKAGHRFNASKLLIDPWARAITGEPSADPALFSFDPVGWPAAGWEERSSDLGFSSRDSAAAMPKCVVVDPSFDWREDRPPRTPWEETVIYECHVRGMTRQHPEVPESLRGTYLGLAEPSVVEHLRSLGVTAIELLPVHQIAREPHLMSKGLPNSWGYSTLGFFAPHAGYATGGLGQQVVEFKEMVRRLHAAGIEVILDVVYNHTAEGGRLGPTLSLRGIDNTTYYRLRRDSRRSYEDSTGCGNTLDFRQPAVRALVLGSLRYWVGEMHVDGFRFDLAPVLGRDGGAADPDAFNPNAALFQAIASDPVVSRVKLIAEPWDLGRDGYQLGRFPGSWAEWNDRYRDASRRFWRGDGGAGELAARLAGSRDLFPPGAGRSVNFVTSHDGFTLRDLVSYEHKHNEANLENNRDGNDHNLSRNWGHEGPSDDPSIRQDRDRARRNLLATLLLSRGVPMLLAGDELGRSQRGNNNAYSQDNEISWVDWSQTGEDQEFLDFVRRLIALRREHPGLRTAGEGALSFWLPNGSQLGRNEVANGEQRAMAMWVSEGSELLLLANGSASEVTFRLPAEGGGWIEVLETAQPRFEPGSGSRFVVAPYSLKLLRRS